MIVSFADAETANVFLTGRSRRFGKLAKIAARRMAEIDFAKALDELSIPPGRRLEKLRGDREGQYSIRVNDQYRICFRWSKDGAHDVEIVDYH
jgi:proteic killer suppression protein